MIALHVYIGNISSDQSRSGAATVSAELRYLSWAHSDGDLLIEAFPSKPSYVSPDQLGEILHNLLEVLR